MADDELRLVARLESKIVAANEAAVGQLLTVAQQTASFGDVGQVGTGWTVRK